jgi:hypothetical protein
VLTTTARQARFECQNVHGTADPTTRPHACFT